MAEQQSNTQTQSDTTIPYPGAFDVSDFEKRAGISMGLIGELMSSLSAIDSFQNMLAARNDPTIPALINSQLANFANFQNQGGVNANNVLSGDFSGNQSLFQPVNFGGKGGGPFDIPFQQAGGNDMTERLFNQLVGPVAIDQLAQYAQGIFGMYSPIPNLRPQTNRPLPNVVSPNFGGILDQLNLSGGGQMQQPPPPSTAPMALSSPPPMQQSFMPGPQQSFMPQQPQQQSGMMKPITSLPMPSFQTGTPYVPQTGPAMLHQGEAVVPAHMNPANTTKPMPPQPGGPQPMTMSSPPVMQGPGSQTGPSMMTMAPMPPAPQPAPQTSMPFDMHTGQPASLPNTAPPPGGFPPEGPPQVPPGTPQTNPLQDAIMFLRSQMMSGGPISPQVQQMQQAQLADTVSLGQQQALNDLRARMGGRGLGGSGLQFGLENDIGNEAMRTLTQGQNQIGLNAAMNNYGALGNTANSLIGGSLGAGQFGLQQAQFNLAQNQSMFDQLMQAIRNTFANPAEQAANTTNVAFV